MRAAISAPKPPRTGASCATTHAPVFRTEATIVSRSSAPASTTAEPLPTRPHEPKGAHRHDDLDPDHPDHHRHPSTIKVTTRLDGREPEGWHVDRSDCGLWESILPGGQTQPVSTKREAEKIARAYLRACKEQGTRWPKMPAPEQVALAA